MKRHAKAADVRAARSVVLGPPLYSALALVLHRTIPYVAICMHYIESACVVMRSDPRLKVACVQTTDPFTAESVARATRLPYHDCVHACQLLVQAGLVSVDTSCVLGDSLDTCHIYTCTREIVMAVRGAECDPMPVQTPAEFADWLRNHKTIEIHVV